MESNNSCVFLKSKIKILKCHFLVLLFTIFSANLGFSTEWENKSPFTQKAFIQNVGQFNQNENFLNNRIEYVASVDALNILFTKEGLTYRYDELIKVKGDGIKQMQPNGEEKENTSKIITQFIHMDWVGANPNVEIISEDKLSNYYTYSNWEDESGKTVFRAYAFKKIIYKNIYPNIDIEYVYPENKKGIKYNIILHPGANPSLIKMSYSRTKGLALKEDGNIYITTPFGDITDHSPLSFYSDSKTKITSSFQLKENVVSFNLSKYDNSKTVIIDPWVVTAAFTPQGVGNYPAGYDVEYDLQGNTYAYGGQWHPYRVVKYNVAGVLQWTYNASFPTTGNNMTYGDFCVDGHTGTSYVLEPYRQGMGVRVMKISTTGVQVGISPVIAGMDEGWRIQFNNCTKKAVIAGGGVTWNNQACVLDTTLTTHTPANVLGATTPLHDFALLALDNSGNYYMMTAKSKNYPTVDDNVIVKGPVTTAMLPLAYKKSGGHAFLEIGSIGYLNNSGVSVNSPNGFNGMAVNSTELYTYDGMTVKRWNKNTTAAALNSVAIGPYAFDWGGIDVDDCGHIFAGFQSSVVQMDVNFNIVATINTPGTVYDVRLGPNNTLHVTGYNFVATYPSGVTCAPSNINVTTSFSGPCSAVTATASATGGLPGYTYIWSPSGGTGQTSTVLTSGTYTVTVADAACNTKTATVTITGVSINVPTSSTPSLCTSSTGTATATPSGGTPNYSYLWSSGDTTATTTSGLAAGTYTVTVTDGSGCSQTATVTVASNNGGLTVSATNTPALCTASNGTATATPASGTPNYSYVWASSGGTAATATGLAPGTYTVTVTDGNGCTATTTTLVGTTQGTLTASAVTTPALCTASNGTATVTPASGIPNYTYVWSPSGGNAATATGLAPGTYTVSVTDGNGCTTTTTALVGQSSGTLAATATSTPALCTALNGTATATTTGGTAGYNYVWTPSGGSAATANNLAPGTYTVTVTDASGCTTTAIATVGQSSGTLSATAVATPALCTALNGTATATPAGGTAGYTYSWSPSGGSGVTANNLAPGTYTVTVTDASGCVTTASAIVTQSSGTLAATTSATSALCGINNGTATAAVTGGTAAYTYFWSPSGGTNATATGLAGGTYTVTVTDASGCIQVQTIVVPAVTGPTASVSPNLILNIGDSTSINATGGGTYSWTPSTGLSCTTCASPVAKPFQTTTYCVVVTDNNGCTASACMTITVEIPCPTNESLDVPNAFSPNKDGVNDEFCLLGWDACLEDFKIVIFDRWGEKVFESADPNFCWDGKYLNNGMDAQVFVYYIKARYITIDKPIVKKGNISLLR